MKLIDRWFGIDKPQDPPSNDLLSAMAASWDQHLSTARPKPVPIERFEEVYEEAVRGFENKGPFGITELTDAWKRICANETPAAVLKECTWPEGHSDADLNVIGVLRGSGEEVTLPCPSCRRMAHALKIRELLSKRVEQRTATAAQLAALAGEPDLPPIPVEPDLLFVDLHEKRKRRARS